jgi:DNA-binding response OmpR family regulator
MANRKIWIVDDEPDILELLSHILMEAGFEVITDLNGEKIDEIKSISPELVILDLRLAGKCGGEICKNLKSDQSTNKIPVLFVSGNADLSAQTAQWGANDYLSKPFKATQLLKKVDENLKAAYSTSYF